MKTAIKKTDPILADESVSTKEIVTTQNAVVKQTADIDGFIAKRQEFIQKVSAICVEGKDYHVIQGKKSLAKGGAEKIASIFQWNATFIKDHEAIEMLGQVNGLVAFKCTLCKGNKFVGEGRGAATLSKNANDPNKTLKMAQKSAFIDAVLRSSGLSDFFTQDLEDMKQEDTGQPNGYGRNSDPYDGPIQSYPPSEKQLELIDKLMDQKRVTQEMVIDMGFNLLELTGGKEGTASELIIALMSYVPTEQQTITIPFNEVMKPQEPTPAYRLFIKDLDECTNIESFNKITLEMNAANKLGKFDSNEWDMVKKVHLKVMARFNPVLETPKRELSAGMAKMKEAMEKAKAKK